MAFDVFARAWNTSGNAPETGDASNITLDVEVNGTDVTGLTVAEVGNGVYSVELSDGQLPEGARFAAHGSSSTDDVVIVGETGVRPYALDTDANGRMRIAVGTGAGEVDLSSGVVKANVTQINGEAVETSEEVDVSAESAQEIRQEIDSNSTQLAAIKTNTDKINTLTEDSSGLRFTEKALEQAPTGEGGSGGDPVGPGSISHTITVEDTQGNPLDGVAVWVSTDQAGSNVVAGTLYTDAFGQVTFMLDEGDYFAWQQRAKTNFDNPTSFEVSA